MFKRRKALIYLAVVMILLFSFTGCSKKAETPMSPSEMYDEGGEYSNSSGLDTNAASGQDDRKIVMNANVRLRVASVYDAVAAAESLTKALGGYVRSSETAEKQGYLSTMIPARDLDTFLSDLDSLGKVLNRSKSSEDVTDRYYDTEIRIINLESQLATMRQLLQKEGWKVAEILEIEREIRRLTDELEILKGQIANMDKRIQYSQVDISFSLENTSISVDDKETFGYSIKFAFKQGVDSLEYIVTFLISAVVFLFPLIPIIILGYVVWRFLIKPIAKKISKL